MIDECSHGDPVAAQERLVFLENIPLLEVSDAAVALAQALVKNVPLPPKAVIDAYHISVAAVLRGRIPRDLELQTHRQPGTPETDCLRLP